MPAVTPVYGLPYPELSDPPHGPNQIQDLAETIETELERIDGPPTIKVWRNAVQACADSATTTISFDSISYNHGFTFTAPSTTITIPKDGIYVVSGSIALNNSGLTGFMQLQAGTHALARVGAFSSFAPTDVTGSFEDTYIAGQTITLTVFHNNGASRNTFGGGLHVTGLSVRWVRDN